MDKGRAGVDSFLYCLSSLPPRPSAQAADFLQDHIQAVALDELHGVVLDSFMLANAKDRDYIGMLQASGRPRLPVKPFHELRIGEAMVGQRLEGDVSPQGFLHGLVHYA